MLLERNGKFTTWIVKIKVFVKQIKRNLKLKYLMSCMTYTTIFEDLLLVLKTIFWESLVKFEDMVQYTCMCIAHCLICLIFVKNVSSLNDINFYILASLIFFTKNEILSKEAQRYLKPYLIFQEIMGKDVK